MKTTHISPEFIYNNVNGTLSMLEKKSFFGSKMIKISDYINIDSSNLIYYQNSNNEQLNLNIESTLTPIIYDTVSDKLNNSSLIMDDSQIPEQKNSNTKWMLNININSLLNNYLFAVLKQYRTFEGVQNNMVISNDVNNAVKDYINSNLLSRYQFDHIDLYISYNDLSVSGLRFRNIWDQKIVSDLNLVKSYTKIDTDPNTLEIIFTQTNSSQSYNFNYYYNLYFIKL